LALALAWSAHSPLAADAPVKPRLKVASDGFPAGHETPEGAACDLARAYISRDASLFTNTCVRLYEKGTGPDAYAKFLKATASTMESEKAKHVTATVGPKAIGKVFAARPLSKDGPAAFGKSEYEFKDVRFVDVGAHLADGRRSLTRTMVILDRDGKWYVHPQPTSTPRLSAGLNEESDSKIDFSRVYDLQK
jgi:hypothetical protein